MIDYLISDDGVLHPDLQKLSPDGRFEVQSLFVDQGLNPRLFDDRTASHWWNFVWLRETKTSLLRKS